MMNFQTATQTAGAIAQDINQYTVEDILAIKAEALEAGAKAAKEYIEQHGEPFYCGFAWVNIYDIKGNTKLGKRMKQAGIEKDYSGAYSIWNPSQHGTQSMDVKEAGAQAACDVFRKYGFKAYMGSRAD